MEWLPKIDINKNNTHVGNASRNQKKKTQKKHT